MPRHDGTTKRKTRKERKRRGRNGQSYHDQVANGTVVPQTRTRKRSKHL
jgi:hypothetical protein